MAERFLKILNRVCLETDAQLTAIAGVSLPIWTSLIRAHTFAHPIQENVVAFTVRLR